MERSTELEIIRTIRDFVAQGTSDADPTMTRIDTEPYRSAVHFEDEVHSVFRAGWLVVGHESEVSQAGEYVARKVLGTAVLIVRGEDGKLRAFRNACRHRGTPVAQGAGCKKSFACPYHGWTYGLDGTLLAIPHEWGFEGLHRADSGLVELDTMVQAGIVHVRLGNASRIESGALEEIAHFLAPGARAFCKRERVVQANWRVIVDGALEAYHIRRTHRTTIYDMFVDNVSHARRLGPDLRVVMPKRSIQELDERHLDVWSLREHSNIVYYRFPNALALILADHAMLLWFDPLTVDRTLVHSMMLVPQDESPENYWLANEALFQKTLEEDYAIGESIQAGLATEANRHFTLGRFEKGVRLFHEILGTVL